MTSSILVGSFGRIPERSKGADCKSAGYAFGGSNPPLPKIFPAMNSSKPEVLEALSAANFQRALQLSEAQLKSISPGEKSLDFFKEAYAICRFFLHRNERIQHQSQGAERARMFVIFLDEIGEFFEENQIPQNSAQVQKIAYHFLHKQISAGFAHDFAGQRAYNLDKNEINQLVYSLFFIENYKSAREVLLFMQSMKRDVNLVKVLLSLCSYYLGNDNQFLDNFSSALIDQPEIGVGYLQFINIPELDSTIKLASERELPDSPNFWVYFAMLLEVFDLPPGRPCPQDAALKKAEERVRPILASQNLSQRQIDRGLQLSAFLLRFNQKGMTSMIQDEMSVFFENHRPDLISQID